MTGTAEATPLTRREIEAKIAKRAWQDEAFRAEFLADPAAAFVKYAGVPAAQLPRIVVHEEAPGAWHIVLPAKPAMAGEMSEEELERVAGGTDVIGITLTLITMSAFLVTSAGMSAAASAGAALITKEDGW